MAEDWDVYNLMFETPLEKRQRKIRHERLKIERVLRDRAVDAILRGEPDPDPQPTRQTAFTLEEIEAELKRRGEL